MTDYLSNQAARAIAANRDRPFFLYLAYNAPHTPLQATRSDYEALSHIEVHAERVYAAMIRALDRGVGIVLDALRESGLEENTLVMFSSDNGGALAGATREASRAAGAPRCTRRRRRRAGVADNRRGTDPGGSTSRRCNARGRRVRVLAELTAICRYEAGPRMCQGGRIRGPGEGG